MDFLIHFSTFSPFFSALPILSHRRTRGSCAGAGSTTHRALLAKTSAVTLAGVGRFQFRFLAGRYKVRMLFQIFDDLFADYFPLKATQCRFDRFVIIYINKCHLFSHLLSAKDTLVRANPY